MKTNSHFIDCRPVVSFNLPIYEKHSLSYIVIPFSLVPSLRFVVVIDIVVVDIAVIVVNVDHFSSIFDQFAWSAIKSLQETSGRPRESPKTSSVTSDRVIE